MNILAVDPGSISAAYAFVGSIITVGDVPVADKMVAAADWHRIVKQMDPDVCVFEKVGSMPKQGIASAFRFGLGTGLLRGVVAGLGIPVVEVVPTKWKKHFNLGADKERGRALALSRFPTVSGLDRKKDHGRADALLMILWYMETQR